MADIIPLERDPHDKMRKLFPWYVTGRLDAEETAELEEHLADCAECQAELRSERALGAEVAGLPMDVERGWSALRQRLQAPPGDVAFEAAAPALPRRRAWRGTGWLVGAQAAAILILGVVVALPRFEPPAQYHALGSPPAAGAGNIVVIFRPETSERELRRTLNDAGARMVDGPTAVDGYVLRVADSNRNAALTRLRSHSDVVLAQPIDAGGAP
jgi:anti-sigma factor RsiW